jgi:hypothetical protein
MIQLTEEQIARVEEIYYEDESENWLRTDLLETTEELHYFATLWNWDDRADALFAIIRNPLCDRGTALHFYWLTDPVHFFGSYATASDIEEWNTQKQGYFELLCEIQQRVTDGFYTIETIAVNPQEIAVGETQSGKLKKDIPEIMLQPSKGEPFPDY